MSLESQKLEISMRLAMEELGYVGVAEPTPEQVAEVSELVKIILDAEPDSEYGKKIAEEIAKGKDSKYMDRFDYHAHYRETITPAVEAILKVFGEHAEELKPVYVKEQTPELKQTLRDVDEKVYLKIHAILNENNVPIEYYKELFNFIVAIGERFRNKANDTIAVEKDLLLSVTVGAKHPEYGNYNVDFATEKQLNEASKEMLSSKGIDRKEYFGE